MIPPHPGHLWEDTTSSVRNKSCPKYALISLAEHGHLTGAPKQTPTRALTVGAQLVLAGKQILDETPSLSTNKTRLWKEICSRTSRTSRTRTSQAGLLDVLLALWHVKALKD